MIDFDYQKLGTGYYDHIFDKKSGVRYFWHDYKFRMIEACLELKPESRILDAGCAAGSFLGRLRKPFQKGVGIDISNAQIEYANKKYGSDRIEFIASDITTLNWTGPRFDAIIFSEMVEHLSPEASLQVLQKLKACLAPSGKLILTTPNYSSLWPFVEFFVNRLSPVSYEHQHIHKLNCHTLKSLLNRAGFEIEEMKTFFIGGPFVAALSLSAASSLSRLESKLFPHLGSLILTVAHAAI